MKKENTAKQDKQEYLVIDFIHIIKSVWHRFWIIVLAGLVAGAAGFAYARFCLTPQYSSSLMLYVNNSSSITGGKFSFNASELTAAQELVDTYTVVLMSRSTLTAIAEDAGVADKYSYNDLCSMIKAGSVNDTEVLRVTVTCSDYKEAAKIAKSITECFPDILAEIITGCDMTVVDDPIPNSQKVSPFISKYAAVSMVIGALIALVVLVILALLDDTIHDEDYLLKAYDYPMLAKVPNLLGNSEKHYSYYYQKKKPTTHNDSEKE